MILRRRGFIAKNRLFFSFLILEPGHRTSQHYENIFPILSDVENQINFVKYPGRPGNKVKNCQSWESRNFFSSFHGIDPDCLA